MREKVGSEHESKESLFILNAAVSDSLMGFYLFILASADTHYGDDYFQFSDDWRNGLVCRTAGFLALLSSEVSLLSISLIAIDRFICVVFPSSRAKVNQFRCKVMIGVLWIVSLVLSIIPVVLAGVDSDAYDLSDVCLGLPLTKRPSMFAVSEYDYLQGKGPALPLVVEYKHSWYFSILIFLVINLVSCTIVLTSYVAMFVKIRYVEARIESKDDVNIAIKMASLVGTRFICWFLIVLMAISAQLEVFVIPLEACLWTALFVLPITAALNPYLYTIICLAWDYATVARNNNRWS